MLLESRRVLGENGERNDRRPGNHSWIENVMSPLVWHVFWVCEPASATSQRNMIYSGQTLIQSFKIFFDLYMYGLILNITGESGRVRGRET